MIIERCDVIAELEKLVETKLNLLRPVYGLLQGIPTSETLGSVYWRKRMPVPQDPQPDRDGCGLMWCAPVAPASGRHGREIARLASEVMLRHGFEPMLSYTLLTERAMICIISISFDRAVPGQDQLAAACYEELEGELDARGYMPYRLGIQSMGRMRNDGAYGDLLQAIKRNVDPAGILAPGRYVGEVPKTSGKALGQPCR